MKQNLIGGLADKKDRKDFDADALKVGTAIEMEHTKDESIAEEIAMDHLTEDAHYYKKLKDIEKSDMFDPMEIESGANIEMHIKGISNPDAAKDLAMYFLNGDPDYYKRLRIELMGKEERRLEITPDGKREWDYGSEPLDKRPLNKRWDGLKKALDADKAFLDLTEQEGDEQPQDKKLRPDEMPQDDSQQGGDQPQQGEEQPQEEQAPQESEEQPPSDEEMAEMLRDEGYGDQEIMHILGGHTPPAATQDDVAVSHDQRMNELEYNQKKASRDPEAEQDHEKRMRDVEHEAAKKKLSHGDLDIEHKKKLQELELAIKKKEVDKEDPKAASSKKEAELELEHKKKMLDLEYSKAEKDAQKDDPINAMKIRQMEFELEMKKLEKEADIALKQKQADLELKYKEKELQLNLKLKEEAAKIKSKMQEEQMTVDHAVNMEVKAVQSKDKIADAKKPKEDKAEK